MHTIILIAVPFLLNIIIGSSGTELYNEQKPKIFLDEYEVQNLVAEVQTLKENIIDLLKETRYNNLSLQKNMTVLTYELRELSAHNHNTDKNDSAHSATTHPLSLATQFASFKSEILHEFQLMFVDQFSKATKFLENNILSTISGNLKSELSSVKDTLWQRVKGEIVNFTNSLSTIVESGITSANDFLLDKIKPQIIALSTHVTSDIAGLKTSLESENDKMINSIMTDVKNEINTIWPQLHELSTILSTNVKNEIEDLKTTLSVNESIKIDNLKSEIVDMKIAFQSQINSLSTSMVSQMGDLGNTPSVSVKNEINSKIEQLRETIQPELDSITNASQSLEGKFDKLENSHLQMIESLANITDKSQDIPQQYTGCVQELQNGGQSGIYKLHLPSSGLEPFDVYCMKDPDNGPAWTVVQRRQDGSTNFYRNWKEYKNGFGDLNKEFFIGLDHLHALTNQAKPQELWIELGDWNGATKHTKYSVFEIGNETSKYVLAKLGTYSGDAGDSLNYHRGGKFSTHDSNNDEYSSVNPAEYFKGAWWFNRITSHLNGEYLRGELPHNIDNRQKGIYWLYWHDLYYSLKYAHIRPSN